MIRIFKLVVLLVISQVAFGQAPSNYTNINGRYRWIAGMFDSTFHIPKGSTPSLRTGGSTNAGALFYKTGDSSLYIYTGTQWLKIAGAAGFVPYVGATQDVDLDTWSLNAKSLHIKGTAGNGHLGLKFQSATPSMSANESGVYADASGNFGLKIDNAYTSIFKTSLNSADRTYTFQNKSYTVGDSADIDARVKYTDTASMLSPYLRSNVAAATYVPLTRTITINGTSQDLSANRTYNVGTVTSVATSTGTGITGGTITSSGTIAADTLLLSTRAWRQKGVDSVASLINTRISGTTNYIPKFTSSSAIGNSAITDNGSITTSLQDFYVTKGNALASITSTNTGGFAVLRFQSSTISDLWFGRESSTSSIFGLTPSSSVIYSEGAYPFITFVNGSERMRLDASGNLGINTSSPAAKLDVQGSSSDQIRLRTAATEYYGIGRNASTGYLDFYGSQSGYVGYLFGGVNGTRMTLDASGNLGLGVTPSAWSSSYKALQINSRAAIAGDASQTVLANNWFTNTSGSSTYIATAQATAYSQTSGEHRWYTAPSGTAGNAISFTQAMTLDASGRLGIGTTSPNSVLEVSGTSATTDFRISRTVSSSTYFYIIAPGGSPSTSIIGINGTDVMTLNASGNVGIGTASPSTRLHIVSGQSSIPDLYIQGAGSSQGWLGFGTTNDYGIQGGADYLAMNFRLNGAERMRITSGGELLINTTSDAGDYKLQVNGSSRINGNLALIDYVGATTNRWDLYHYSDNTLRMNYNGAGNDELILSTGGNLELTGSIKTAAPSGGNAAAWKLGERVASAGVTFNDQQYIQLDIGGTLYYLATVDLPMPEAYPQATSGPSNNYKITPVQVKTTKDAEIEKLRKEIEELKQLIKNK